MANTTITDLPNATTPLGPEYIVLDQGGETKRLQLSDLFQTSGSETITSLTQNGNVLSYTNEAGVVNTIDTIEAETVTSLSLLNGVLSYTDEVAQTTNLTLIPDGSIGYAKLSLGAPAWNEAGGLIISGHSSPIADGYYGGPDSPLDISSGTFSNDATNLWLKGNSAGASGIFFESNAVEWGDGAFIQYNSHGIDNTTGEQSDLVIGVTNDTAAGYDDMIVLSVPGKDQLVATFDYGATRHKIWHAGNDGANSGLDADLLDGKDGSLYVTTDTAQNITGAKTFQDTVDANGTVFTTYDDNLNADSPNDPGVLTVGVELGLGMEPVDGKLQSFIDFHAGNVYTDYAARIWRRHDGEFEISQRGPAALRLTTAFETLDGASIALTNASDIVTPNLITHQADDHKFINIAGTERMKITADGDIIMDNTRASVGFYPEVEYRVLANSPSTHIGDYAGSAASSSHGFLAVLNVKGGDDDAGGLFIGTKDENGDESAILCFNQGAVLAGGTAGEIFKVTTAGNVFVAGNTVSVGTATASGFFQSSDYRLKEDITSIDNSIERLKQLKPCNFAWKSDGTRVDGFIAHEAQEIVPVAVAGTKDAIKEDGTPGYQGIDQSKLIPLLTKALQDAIARIEVLEAK